LVADAKMLAFRTNIGKKTKRQEGSTFFFLEAKVTKMMLQPVLRIQNPVPFLTLDPDPG